jgi:chromosome partitioning protein
LIYAVANQKGGVGKTTTAINLASTLAQAGEGVLLIDIDPQANATTGLGVRSQDDGPTAFELVLGEAPLPAVVTPTPVDGLDLVPSSREMAGLPLMLSEFPEREYCLRKALQNGMIHEKPYSYVFVDCPPSLGLLTVNALVAAERVIVPVQTEYYALEGLVQLLETVEAVRERLNPELRIAGLVLTMADLRTNLTRQVELEVRCHFPELTFSTIIPRNVRLAEAPSHGVPVSLLDPYCPGTNAYFDLAQEVVDRGR